MKRAILAVLSLLPFLLLTGCWSKFELTDWIFVQAAALDMTEDNKVLLTTHFYRPVGGNGGESGPKSSPSYFNIKTEGDTVFEAARKVLMHAGRKGQWSHMRVLLISEKLARTTSVNDILDLFARDQEPRGTMSVHITQGEANKLLDKKPIIEQTIGQELVESEMMTHKFTGKTLESTMLELSIQFRSETGVAILPYVRTDKLNPEVVSVGGIALLKEGKLKKIVHPEQDAEGLLMLLNKYKGGIIEFPCENSKGEKKKEALRVDAARTRMVTFISNDDISAKFSMELDGSIGELRCSSVTTFDEERAFIRKIEETAEQKMRKAFKMLQAQKLDATGIGNRIYARYPSLWKKVKPGWEERFSRLPAEIEVKIRILDTGMNVGKPYGG